MTALATIIGRGLHSARPAAGTPGSIYYETDTSTLFRDNGASWDNIEAAGATGTAGGDLAGTYPNPTLDLTKAHIWTAKQEVSAFRITPGATAGAPTTGAHVIGDLYIDSGGTLYECTVAGTPGTWVSGGGGGSSTLAGDTDVSIASLANFDQLQYQTADSKFHNVAGGMVRIAPKQVLGSAAASITFASIPSGYTNLILVLDARGDTAATFADVNLTFNGDTAANYDNERIQASGATTPTTGESIAGTSIDIGAITAATAPANVSGGIEVHIPNYAGTTFQKSLWRIGSPKLANSTGNIFVQIGTGWWRSAAAITSITLTPSAGNFAAGTTATLYGVA